MPISLGFGKEKQDSSSKTSYTPNAQTMALFNPTFQQASSLLQGQATPYTGQLGAGTSQMQQQAYDSFQPGQGSTATGNAVGAVQQGMGYRPQNIDVGQISQTDLSQYFDPYQQEVIDNSLADINRSRGQQMNADSAAFTRGGAWGGSRQGVADSLTNEAALRQSANTSAALRSQGYQNAQQMAGQDIQSRYARDAFNQQMGLQGAQFGLQGAGLLGQLGMQQQQMGLADTNAQMQMGNQQQATQQNINNQQYQEFLRQYQDPFLRSQGLTGLLGSIGNLYAGATQRGTGSQTGTSVSAGFSGGQ